MATTYKALINDYTITRNDSGAGSTVGVYTVPANRYAIAFMSIASITALGTAYIYAGSSPTKVSGTIADNGLLCAGQVIMQAGETLNAQFAGGSGLSVSMKIQVFEFGAGIEA